MNDKKLKQGAKKSTHETEKFGVAARLKAGEKAVPKTITATPEQQATADRIFGPLKAELKTLGLPHDDFWQVVGLVEQAGYCVDDLTYGEVHEMIVSVQQSRLTENLITRLRDIESIKSERVPLSTLANKLDVSKNSLYRLRDKGYLKVQKIGKTPLFVYRRDVDLDELSRLLELQRKQQLRGQK